MKRLYECGCNSEMDHSNTDNYMFFQNLKTIKTMVDAMLKLDPKQVDQILSKGHGWAADHIATSKDDVEEVGGFLMNSKHSTDSYNTQQPQFVPVGFKNHLQTVMKERIVKQGDVYAVKTSAGDRTLGTHPSKKAALQQLAAIEISKKKSKSRKKKKK